MSPTIIGILLFCVFLVFAALMYTGRMPALIALPLMAASLYLVGGFFFHEVSFQYPGSNAAVLMKEFVRVVIEEGMPRLLKYIITVMLGAVLAELLKTSGVSRTIIRWASELGGDNKVVMCLLLTGATALLFTSLAGLGGVIMVATIVLPVLLGIGISAPVAGSIFLLGMSLGGAFNPVNWALFINVLKAGGMDESAAYDKLLSFVVPFAGLFFVVVMVYILLNARKMASSFWAVQKESGEDGEPAAGGLALLSPVIPILLILSFNIADMLTEKDVYDFPINTALLIGVIYCLATTGRGPNGRFQRLAKSIFDAVSASAPVIALIIGIGMTIRVVWDPAVSTYMEPVLARIVPGTPVMYVIVFTALAPLALYRGPFNVWGMGIAVGSIIISTGVLPPLAVMGMLYSVGMIQGVSDPTNTHNAWIAGFLGEDVNVFTRRTLPYTWLLAAAGLVLAAFKFF